MKSSSCALKLRLGDSLGSEVAERAKRMKCTSKDWLLIFLAKGRLTPDETKELLALNHPLFFARGALNAYEDGSNQSWLTPRNDKGKIYETE